jgi:hypothetical protein
VRLAGYLEGARELSLMAKMWAIWSALSGPILLAIWIIFFGGLMGLGALSGNY